MSYEQHCTSDGVTTFTIRVYVFCFHCRKLTGLGREQEESECILPVYGVPVYSLVQLCLR